MLLQVWVCLFVKLFKIWIQNSRNFLGVQGINFFKEFPRALEGNFKIPWNFYEFQEWWALWKLHVAIWEQVIENSLRMTLCYIWYLRRWTYNNLFGMIQLTKDCPKACKGSLGLPTRRKELNLDSGFMKARPKAHGIWLAPTPLFPQPSSHLCLQSYNVTATIRSNFEE